MKSENLPAPAIQQKNKLMAEIKKLTERLDSAKTPNPEAIERLRQIAAQSPAFLAANSIMGSLRQQLLEKLSNGTTRAIMLAEVDALKKQLDFDNAPPLERLLIDHILTVRLRLIHAENTYNNAVVNQSISFKLGEYWDNLLSSTQARFLRAIETLARVRRLARNTPALQINIAQEGGKQVNIQSNATGQNAAPAHELATGEKGSGASLPSLGVANAT